MPLDVEAFATEVALTIGAALNPVIERMGAIEQRQAAHEQRQAALEAQQTAHEEKPHVKFVGVFQPGRTYESGDATVHAGSLWICKVRTAGKPGEDYIGWQLAVKRGAAQ